MAGPAGFSPVSSINKFINGKIYQELGKSVWALNIKNVSLSTSIVNASLTK